MRVHVALLLVVLLAPTAAAEQRIEVRGEALSPTTVLASDWETVRWVWPANETHELIDARDGSPWCEPTANGCVRFFAAPGTYRYHCALHPTMVGSVVVERGTGGDAAAPLHAFFVVEQQGLSATFDASAAARSRTAVESFEWDFGDGTNGTGRIARHDYAGPGEYVVRLTITDEFGDSDTNGRRINLSVPGDPDAYFRTNATGRAVLFEAQPNDTVLHVWHFGDGTQAMCTGGACQEIGPDTVASSPTSLVHVYHRGGTYVVTHRMYGGPEAAQSSSWAVHVDGPETFDVHVDGLDVVVNASPLGTYGNASYAWLFGDLDRAVGLVARHSFPEPGRWSVELTLHDGAGNLTLEREVLIEGPAPSVERLLATELRPPEPARPTPFPLGVVLVAVAIALLAVRPESYK